jgi:hypothetical protein
VTSLRDTSDADLLGLWGCRFTRVGAIPRRMTRSKPRLDRLTVACSGLCYNPVKNRSRGAFECVHAGIIFTVDLSDVGFTRRETTLVVIDRGGYRV